MGEDVGRGAEPCRSDALSRTAIVAGGGLAGITAALDLADVGWRVTLLEVRPQLGGAAYSFRRGELTLDNGQHVFLRCCTDYRALLERLGTTGETVLQDRLEIPVIAPGRPVSWLRRSGLPAPLHLAGALLRYPFLSVVERVAAGRATLALARVDPGDPAVDAQSFGTWLRARGQSRRTIDALWELIGRPTLNVAADDASLALAAFVFQEGLLRDRAAGDIGYARAPLGVVHGEAAERALRAAGVEVRTGRRVEAIEHEPDLVTVRARGGEAVQASALVLAVPHERAAQLLPSGVVADPQRLLALGHSPIVNLHVVLDRPVFDLPFAAVVDSPLQYVFDRTDTSGLGTGGQCLAISLSAADAEAPLSDGELQERFLPELIRLLPRASTARVERFVVTREHHATFRAAPGVAGLRPGPRTAFSGLALAGAWTDTGWPATMEGAVRSGHAAAAALRSGD